MYKSADKWAICTY